MKYVFWIIAIVYVGFLLYRVETDPSFIVPFYQGLTAFLILIILILWIAFNDRYKEYFKLYDENERLKDEIKNLKKDRKK